MDLGGNPHSKQDDCLLPATTSPAASGHLDVALEPLPNGFNKDMEGRTGKEGVLDVQRQASAEQEIASVVSRGSCGIDPAGPAPEVNLDVQHPDEHAVPCATTPTAAVGAQRPEPKRGLGRLSTVHEVSEPKRIRRSVCSERKGDADGEADDVTLEGGELPAAGQLDGHPRDVVLRIEFATSTEMKVLAFLMASTLLAGMAITAYFKVSAQKAGMSWYLINSDTPTFRDNFIAGLICCGLLLSLWLLYMLRGSWFMLRRRHWDQRRFRVVLLRFIELTISTLNMAAWTYAGSSRRLQSNCRDFHAALLFAYALRLTASNTLLCIWTMSARGITVNRGGPLSLGVRVKLLVQHQMRRCFWATYQSLSNVVQSQKSASSAEGAAAGLSVGAAAAAVPASEAPGPAGTAVPASQAEDAASRLVVRELKVEGQGASEVLAARVVIPEVSVTNGTEALNATRPTEAAGGAPPAVPLPELSPATAGETAEGAVVGGPTTPGVGIMVDVRAVLPEPEPEPLSLPGPTPSAPADVGSAASPPSEPIPTGNVAQARGAHLEQQKAIPVVDADSAVGAAALVAAAAATAIADERREPERQAEMEVSRAAAIAADLMAEETGIDEELYIDAPWWDFWAPVLWLWMPFQGLVGLNVGYLAIKNSRASSTDNVCINLYLECRSVDNSTIISLAVLLIAEAVYVVIYFYFCVRGFAYLRSRSYVLYRQLNIFLSIEVRIRGVAIIFLVVNEFVQALIVPAVTGVDGNETSCRFSLDSVLGLWSAQVVEMMVVLVVAWIHIPRSVLGDVPIMQATLQRFAWTEADLARQRALRLNTVRDSPYRIAQLDREPMFCFETAVKLTYWCEHAYYYEEAGCEMRLPLEKLMKLLELEHVLVKRNEDSDAKVVIGWTWKHCLLSFRGTASLKAACVDLQAMLVPYYQRACWKQKYKVAALAAVHHGFQWSWTHGGFNQEVLDWVRSYRERHPHGKIIVTGHSLGGAHAVLCALDLARELGESLPHQHLMCYTYGAPRVGNHAFAGLYNKVVAETWHVINGNDMIPLSPKYVGWFVYKQPGHKVIVKRKGDIVVRPTFVENSVVRLPCSRSVRQHLLGSYLRSLMAVLRSQTRGKHIEGGVRGLLHLSRYDLPEVTGVLVDLVKEVRAVAIAAATAVDNGGRGADGNLNMTPRQAAAAAATAAARAGPNGHLVLHFMVKHQSLRLLLDEPVIAAADAAAAAPSVPIWSDDDGDDDEGPRRKPAKKLLRGIMHRIDLGMQLLGVETGMKEEDDDASGSGQLFGRRKGVRSVEARAAREAELEAFRKAAACHSAAQSRYKRMKSLRARERRAGAGLGRVGSWVSGVAAAAAAGLHGRDTPAASTNVTSGVRGPAATPRRSPLSMQGRRTKSESAMRAGSRIIVGDREAGGDAGDGGGSGAGSGGKGRRKLRAARHSDRGMRNAGALAGGSGREGSPTSSAGVGSLRAAATLTEAGPSLALSEPAAAVSGQPAEPAPAQPVAPSRSASAVLPGERTPPTTALELSTTLSGRTANRDSVRNSGPVAESLEDPARRQHSQRGLAASANPALGRSAAASVGEDDPGRSNGARAGGGSGSGGHWQGSGSGSGADWLFSDGVEASAGVWHRNLMVHADAVLAAVAVTEGSMRAVHRAVELERLALVREETITAIDYALEGQIERAGNFLPWHGTRPGEERRSGGGQLGALSQGPSDGSLDDIELGGSGAL